MIEYTQAEKELLQKLADTGGVIKPHMFYSFAPARLKEIWTTGDWILLEPKLKDASWA